MNGSVVYNSLLIIGTDKFPSNHSLLSSLFLLHLLDFTLHDSAFLHNRNVHTHTDHLTEDSYLTLCLAIFSLNLSKSVIDRRFFLSANRLAQDDFSHCPATSAFSQALRIPDDLWEGASLITMFVKASHLKLIACLFTSVHGPSTRPCGKYNSYNT